MSSPTAESKARSWPNYRTVWRWHFYAGLFCIPFVILLSITGAIYLFKPQIESWLDRPYDNLTIEHAATAEQQVEAALRENPNTSFFAYEIPATEHAAARVLLLRDTDTLRVYVHPQTLQILGTIREDDRPMNFIMRIHGELLLGNTGSAFVELAASWAIIMIITGLYLWWPRSQTRLAGVVYPRLSSGNRTFWRDIHAVSGLWISAFALFLLITGLPWANLWGSYFEKIRHLTHTDVVQQDWPTGHAQHNHDEVSGNANALQHGRYATLDKIISSLQPLYLAPPVLISPPALNTDEWTAKSDAQNRPLRADLILDGESGKIVQYKRFNERHIVDQVVGYGIAAHEGQLFGWLNQLLGLITALGLITLCTSSIVLWWRRRGIGVLGAPAPISETRYRWSLYLIVVMLAVYLPLFAVSLLAVVTIERCILQRIPVAATWLGIDRA